MLRIHLSTGTVWTKSIEVEGDKNSDLVQLIDDYYNTHKELPVTMYTYNDLLDMFTKDDLSIDENGLSMCMDGMLPINGGEYYIEGIEWVEEI